MRITKFLFFYREYERQLEHSFGRVITTVWYSAYQQFWGRWRCYVFHYFVRNRSLIKFWFFLLFGSLSEVLFSPQKIGVLIRGYFIRLSSQPPSPLARAVALFMLLLPSHSWSCAISGSEQGVSGEILRMMMIDVSGKIQTYEGEWTNISILGKNMGIDWRVGLSSDIYEHIHELICVGKSDCMKSARKSEQSPSLYEYTCLNMIFGSLYILFSICKGILLVSFQICVSDEINCISLCNVFWKLQLSLIEGMYVFQ